MFIRFKSTVEDMVVFSTYYFDHSPAQRRLRTRTTWAVLMIVLLLYGLLAWGTQNPSWLILGVVIAGLLLLIMPWAMRKSVANNARRVYAEGANKATLGPHELEVSDNGLAGRSPSGEFVVAWPAIEKVVSHGDYTFIHVSAISALVIPREAVSDGNYEAFVDAVEQQVALCKAAVEAV